MLHRVPVALLVLLSLLVVPATVAAAQPELRATSVPGREINVVGSGFPASSDVTLVIQHSNNPDQTQTLHADETGTFTATIDAGPGRGGVYTLVATAGAIKAVAEVFAVETAGGTGGTIQTPPSTSTLPRPGTDGGSPGAPILPAVAIGLAGFLGACWAVRRLRHAAD